MTLPLEMEQPRTILIGISGCSSSGKTTLARLLRDIFPETFILHEDDFYKPESELPIKDGLLDWDCPEAISIPDLEAALTHIRETGSSPVSSIVPNTTTTPSSDTNPCSSTSRLSHRSGHGCTSSPLPLPPPPSSPRTPLASSSSSFTSLPSSGKSSSSRSSLTTTMPARRIQASLISKEDQNSVGPSPISPSRLAHCTAKVRAWLAPGQPGSLIFSSPPPPPRSSAGESNENDSQPTPQNQDDNEEEKKKKKNRNKKNTRLCILDGFLLFSPQPQPLCRVTSLLDIKLFLQVSKQKALQRREARDGYVTLEGFWKDPPGYVEKIVWPNYAAAHRWMFVEGVVEGGRLDEGVLRREGIRAMAANQGKEDAEFGEMLEWAVQVVMDELERICLGGEKGVDGARGDGDAK
ncbi:putative nicotinamide riboside protein [Chaetomium strumarium]|uniref:Nicotinamide riboside protein n=1 Tax=Chaetomium strumarium TaxID=1170767 RepID=A0AAJ0GQJ5_9PEZI|nr:putative nicotinamide riboside protein [Chaetomium strumarium]